MKRVAELFILVLCCGFNGAVGQNTSPSGGAIGTADRAELARLEGVWNLAHLQGDAEALERMWAEDLEVTVPRMRVWNKSELVAFVRSGQMKFSRYETSDLRIRTYGSTAIVSGRLQRRRTIGDREVNDDWRFTKIYLRSNNGWQVVAFHASESVKP